MTSMKRKQRREQERQRKKLYKKLNRVSNRAIDNIQNNGVVDTSENLGLSKMSDHISDFAEPLYNSSWDQDGIDDIHELVCCCWNIGTCDDEWEDFLWDFLIERKLDECFDDPDRILANKLSVIIEQQRTKFAEDRRFIMDFRLEFTQDNVMNLRIVSTPMSQKDFLAMQAARMMAMEAGTLEA